MKYILYVALIVLAVCVTRCASAAPLEVGKQTQVRAPICKTKASAIAAAQADADSGIPAALQVLKAAEDCGMAQFQATVVAVVFSAKTERGATVRVLEVKAEMEDGTWQTLYVLTDVEVKAPTMI